MDHRLGHAHTDAVGTDGCKTSASVIPQSEIRIPQSSSSGIQPQPCAACSQPTIDPRPACWVCVEKAKNMPAQMEESAAAQADTARINAIGHHGNTYVGSLFIANPGMDPRDVLDLLVMKEVG